MRGTVQELGQTGSGSLKVKIDGKWFYPGRTPTDGLSVGALIDFESKKFPVGNDGKTLDGLNKWSFADAGPINSVAPTSATAAKAQNGNGHAPAGKIPVEYMAFISNSVAHLIDAGRIAEPGQVGPWVHSLYASLEIKDFDDDISKIPF